MKNNILIGFLGRKFTMERVRNRMFQIQRDFLRIKPDIFYDSHNTEELSKEFERISIELPSILINDQVRFFKGIITTIANRFFLLHFGFCVMVYLL